MELWLSYSMAIGDEWKSDNCRHSYNLLASRRSSEKMTQLGVTRCYEPKLTARVADGPNNRLSQTFRVAIDVLIRIPWTGPI